MTVCQDMLVVLETIMNEHQVFLIYVFKLKVVIIDLYLRILNIYSINLVY